MSHDFNVAPPMLKEISQALMQMKANARSVEGSAEALLPLAGGKTEELLESITLGAGRLERDIQTLYISIAREAANV